MAIAPQQMDFPSLAFPKDRTVLYVSEFAAKLRVTEQHTIDLITEGKLAAVDIAGRQEYVRVPMDARSGIAAWRHPEVEMCYRTSERIETMSKYLHVMCDAGLANRMRSIVGAQRIAELTKRELRVYWPSSEFCGVAYDILFGNPLQFTDIKALLATRDRVKVYNCGCEATATDECFNVDPADEHEHVVIKTWAPPKLTNDTWAEVNKRLRDRELGVNQFMPRDVIMERQQAIRPILNRGTLFVGIHYRWGDPDPNDPTKPTSSTARAYAPSDPDAFLAAADTIQAYTRWMGYNVEFFVASPNRSACASFATRLPNCWSYDNLSTNRSDLQGMQDALLDMMTLSECHLILGSYWSQYSKAAAEIGNCPMIEVGTSQYIENLEATLTQIIPRQLL